MDGLTGAFKERSPVEFPKACISRKKVSGKVISRAARYSDQTLGTQVLESVTPAELLEFLPPAAHRVPECHRVSHHSS